MTKIVHEDMDVADFLTEVLDAVRFPGALSIDAHGFVQSKDDQPVFIFGSPNSSIMLWNDKQHVVLQK